MFREYLNQVNKRVTSNDPILKANENFIAESLSKLSLFLWENNTREIPINEFYNLIDGKSAYEKDRSKADILINEGLVITRDMRSKNEYISFTYDTLAGFMIGEYLIQKHPDVSYFISKKFIQKIINSNRQHPLFEDIMTSLCLLLPQLKLTSFHELCKKNRLLKFTKSNVFSYLPKFITNRYKDQINFSNYAFEKSISCLFILPAKAVKESDIQLVEKLYFLNNENKKIFYDLSFKTLGDVRHPLNAIFFSRLLASLKMNERDISWSEYIRKKSYNIEEYILEFERQCRSTDSESMIVSDKQHIVSRIIVWFLTSTNKDLRDKSTRALYFYGRKFPNEFSSLAYNSLKFNDPYVWERTLAALYGVVMAEHNSTISDNFRNHILPELSKNIYDLIFKENAQHSTTHILARDYARRIIEIGLIHKPNLFTEKEIKNIRPPYKFGGIRSLGEFDYGDQPYNNYDGPIYMDFSNYTIGRIVNDGHAYSDPPEKQKVRRQIYWRIFNLGWDYEIFKEADKDIDIYNYYRSTEQVKIERYGKKYSWIAYFENAGLRDDLGLLDKDRWNQFRLPSSDIDPSFPEEPKNELFFTHNILGDKTTTLVEWYENGGMPSVEDYLTIKDLKGNLGNWICLDSFISQENIPIERNCFIYIRGLIIKNNDYSNVIKYLKMQNMSKRRLFETQNNYYTYADELYIYNDATHSNQITVELEIGKEKIKTKRSKYDYYPSIFSDLENDKRNTCKEIEVPIIKEFDVLMPVMEYNWEDYHSSINNAGHNTIVAKEIANHLKLVSQPQTFDLLDSNGSIASLNLKYFNNYNNNHSFVYIRKDLLDKYLLDTNCQFAWAIWGERDVRFQSEERRQEYFNANPFKEYQVFQKVIEYIT